MSVGCDAGRAGRGSSGWTLARQMFYSREPLIMRPDAVYYSLVGGKFRLSEYKDVGQGPGLHYAVLETSSLLAI